MICFDEVIAQLSSIVIIMIIIIIMIAMAEVIVSRILKPRLLFVSDLVKHLATIVSCNDQLHLFRYNFYLPGFDCFVALIYIQQI